MRQPDKTPAPAQLEAELKEVLHGLKAWGVQNSGLYGMPPARKEDALELIERGSRILAQLKELGLLKNELEKLATQFRQIALAGHSDASAEGDEHLSS